MEESQQPMQGNTPSYWTSVAVAGIVFGLLSFALTLINNYATINSEPSGAIFSPIQLIGICACLISAFGGMLAAWHYAKEYDMPIKLGKGALMGFLTGVVMVLVSVVLGQIWQLIDPDMTEKMIEATIANFEAMGTTGNEQMMDGMIEGVRSQQNVTSQLLWGIPMMGILNLITGMIGAKLFGKKEDELV